MEPPVPDRPNGLDAQPEVSMRTDAHIVVPIVVGTRPEAIKLVPLILALRDSEYYEPLIVSTGQHHRIVNYIFDLVGVRPDVTLWSGARYANLNARVASVVERFEDFCAARFGVDGNGPPGMEAILTGRYPGAVLVHGDTTSAMAAALSAFHLRLPVAHVEAGLRTGNRLSPFPEELNREFISRIAAFHLAPTAKNLENLVRENIPIGQIFVTGNTGIDALQWATTLEVRFANAELQALHDSDARIVVVTAHRRENWGPRLHDITEAVSRLAARRPDVHFVVPMHPNPAVREVFVDRLSGVANVLLSEPLGYATFAKLLARSHLVLTDSGGIQEEAPSLDKPVLVLRESTERVEGIEAGTLRLVGTDPDVITRQAELLLDDPVAYAEMAHATNPYGDGHAAERMVGAVEHILLGRDAPTPFGPGYSRRAVAKATGLLELADVAASADGDEMRGHDEVYPDSLPDTVSADG